MAMFVDVLTTVYQRNLNPWTISADEVTITGQHTPAGPDYRAFFPSGGGLHEWSGRPWEGAIAWLVEQGKRDVLLGDHWAVRA